MVPRALLPVLLLASALPLGAAVMTADGFEDGHLDKWRVKTFRDANAGTIVSAPDHPVLEGKHSFRAVASRAAAAQGQAWCEFGRYFAQVGAERWWAFSLYLPEDYPDLEANTVLHQVHSVQDRDLNEPSQAPLLVMRLEGGRLLIENRWDANAVSRPERYGRGGTIGNETIYDEPVDRGRWVHWVFRARFSFGPQGPGLIEVWKDGAPVARREGPNCYNNQATMTIRFGLYKRDWSRGAAQREAVAYYDRIIVADERESLGSLQYRAR